MGQLRQLEDHTIRMAFGRKEKRQRKMTGKWTRKAFQKLESDGMSNLHLVAEHSFRKKMKIRDRSQCDIAIVYTLVRMR